MPMYDYRCPQCQATYEQLVSFSKADLGACNPQLAHRALELKHNVGLLLPCNVVVHEVHEGDGSTHTRVDIADPVAMLGIIRNPAMQTVASEARNRLQRVVASLNTTKIATTSQA